MDDILAQDRDFRTGRHSRRHVLSGLIGALASPGSFDLARNGQPSGQPYDLLLRDARVADGTGGPIFTADVAVQGERIVRIAPEGARNSARLVIDARGLILAPGFIDMHAHVSAIDRHPTAENFLRQGITTIFDALHSEDLPWPLIPYERRYRAAPNVAYTAGHNWARKRIMGLAARSPTRDELAQMRRLIEAAMRAGAFGLSTGLEYIPSAYARTDEVIALAKVAARYHGIYVTHMRDEGARSMEAVAEALRIGREGQLPVHINHHKLAGRAQWGWSSRTLGLIEAARTQGQDVTLDLYPYDAFSTVSDVLFPPWSLEGGPSEFAGRVSQSEIRARLVADMVRLFPEQTGQGPQSVQFRDLPQDPPFRGKTLADLALARGRPLTPESISDLLIELQLQGGFLGIFHSMSEEDIERIMRYPHSMFCTDGDLVTPDTAFAHPRSYGSFPRVLARYVREKHVLTLEQAIHKMTAQPAARLGFTDRGRVSEGAIADLVLFDPDRITDLGTYADPNHYAQGVRHLLVNGTLVIRDSALTGALPGRPLRRPPRRSRSAAALVNLLEPGA